VAAGVFGVMLTLNIMISLEFEKDKTLPSLTLIELGNRAYAYGESGGPNSTCTVSPIPEENLGGCQVNPYGGSMCVKSGSGPKCNGHRN
jgi:hypothetical protein